LKFKSIFFLLLGERYTVQIGQVCFAGARNYSYEGLIFTRENDPTLEDKEKATNSEKKKAFKFNMPSKLIIPLRDALNTILAKSTENSGDK
jgi:hypothetical protein